MIHIAIWLVFLLYDWIIRQNIIQYPQYAWLEFKGSSVRVFLYALTTYFILHPLLKNPFLNRNKVWMFASIIFLTLVSGLLIRALVFLVVYSPHHNQPFYVPYAFQSISRVALAVINGGFIYSVASMIYFNNAWHKQLTITEQANAAHKVAELELLRSQVKPHFIFNTLNNLYALSMKQSPKTPEMIYRLSDLLRYMLYDSQQERISLNKELVYISNYLELEKLRYNGKLDISINKYNDTGEVLIPPLILLPLVENCIKHGASQQVDLSWIRIDISTEKDWLLVKIENSKSGIIAQDTTSKGIGIQNVKKRLEWIYKEQQSFEIKDEEETFLVVLKVKYKGVK